MVEEVFVFGSNLAGRHGAGSAKAAYLKHGAIYGVGVGRQGHSYAIPTKDRKLRSLSLPDIRDHVDVFKRYAQEHPDIIFNVVDIGCGLAGYSPYQIAPMFEGSPPNVYVSTHFARILARLAQTGSDTK